MKLPDDAYTLDDLIERLRALVDGEGYTPHQPVVTQDHRSNDIAAIVRIEPAGDAIVLVTEPMP